MRKVVLFLFPLLLLFCSCDVSEMGTLREFSRPYTGVYRCTELTYGEKDMLDLFDYVRLELKADSSFALSYRTAQGGEASYGGQYAADPEGETITFTAASSQKSVQRTFPMEEGEIRLDVTLYGTLVHAVFKM